TQHCSNSSPGTSGVDGGVLSLPMRRWWPSRPATNQRPAGLYPEDTHDLEDPMNDLSGRTTIVVGASRGLGRGIATAFAEAGARVVAVSRTAAAFPEPANRAGTLQPEVADAGDATVAGRLLDRYEPEAVILV